MRPQVYNISHPWLLSIPMTKFFRILRDPSVINKHFLLEELYLGFSDLRLAGLHSQLTVVWPGLFLGQELSPESHFLRFQSLGLLSSSTNLQVPFLQIILWPVGQPFTIRVPRNRTKSNSSKLLCDSLHFLNEIYSASWIICSQSLREMRRTNARVMVWSDWI